MSKQNLLQASFCDHNKQVFTEIPKHVGPTDKSGKNLFGPEKHLFPLDQMSGNVPMLRMFKPFPMLVLKFKAGAIPGKKLKRRADTDANVSK